MSIELANLEDDMHLNVCYELMDGSADIACGRTLELADLRDCSNIWLTVYNKDKEVG